MKKYFVTGLLVLVPIFITAWVIISLIHLMDQSLLLLPANWQLSHHIWQIPGVGALLTLAIVFITGVIATNFLGKRLLNVWELILRHVPIVRTIYTSVKQVSDTIFADSSHAFRQAVLVRFPHQNSWTIGFITGMPSHEITAQLTGEEFISVYVPTTPNPTSGYLLMLPKAELIVLDMSVNQALKYVISMGTVPVLHKT